MSVIPIDHHDPLAMALRYAGVGLRVVPIRPGAKVPPMGAWQDVATTDRATIESWWSGLYRGHGIGLVLGRLDDYSTVVRWIFAVDVDQHGIDGAAELAALVAHHGPLPDTVEAITGGGGRHHLFSSAVEIRNGKLCPGVDIRGASGQIVVEPTVHPSGVRYQWVDGHAPWEHEIAPAPAWMVEHLTRPARVEPAPKTPQVLAEVGTRPGDLWAASTSWRDLLEGDGWTFVGRGPDGEERVVRPGKSVRDGISATIGYGGSDVLKVFTSSVPHLDAEQTYSRFGYYAATRHHGDHAAASAALSAAGWHAPRINPAALISPTMGAVEEVVLAESDEDGWPIATVDTLRAIIDGDYEPVRPDLLQRTDGACLLYSGKVNSIAAEPGSGKTWIALKAAHDVLTAGGKVVWIDWEDRVDTAVRRLLQLGTPHQAIIERFAYVEPTFATTGGAIPANVIEAATDAALVVIDSMGEALAHSRLDQNSDGEVGAWMASAARPLARGGSCVVIIDHMVKKKDDQGRFAIGSQRKLAGISGIAYTAAVLAAASVDKSGKLVMKVSKDRHGNFPHGSTVAEIGVHPTDGGGVQIVVGMPDGSGDAQPEKLLTHLMMKVSLLLEDQPEGMSSRAIEGSITTRASNTRTAIRQLIEAGYAEQIGAGRSAVIVSVRRYREPSDLIAKSVDNPVDNHSSESRPIASQSRPGRDFEMVPKSRPTASPPVGDADAISGLETPQSDADETPFASRPVPDWI